MDLSTSVRTQEKVKKRFNEVVKIFIDELFQMGTLNEVLTGLGWTKIHKSWSVPIPIFIIRNNLRVLGISIEQFLNILKQL